MKKTSPSSNSRDSSFEREPYLYLTTRGRRSGVPREIEIWFTQLQDRFYLVAEYPSSNWVQNLSADPKVRLRVAGKSFDALARIVTPGADPELHRTVLQHSREKYGWGDGLVVELTPQAAD